MSISKQLETKIRRVRAKYPDASYKEIARRAKTYYARVKAVLGRAGNAVEGTGGAVGWRCPNGHLIVEEPCLTCAAEQLERDTRRAIRVTGEIHRVIFIGWVTIGGVRQKIRGELRVEGGLLEAVAQLKGYVNSVSGSAPAAYEVLLNGELVTGSI